MCRLVISGILIFSFNALVAAQSKPQSDEAKAIMRDSNRREMDQLLLRKPITTVEDNSTRLAKLKQVNEDFRNLQILNNEVPGCLSEQVNYFCASRTVSAINSRAKRLKTNLQLPFDQAGSVKEEWKAISTADDLRSGFRQLEKLIEGFVNNPTFRESRVVDVEEAKRAAHDLVKIVELSKGLVKASTNLERLSGK